MASNFTFVTEKRAFSYAPGWSRKVDVNGVIYWVGVEGVRRVRIPYKPRGQNIGWQYNGFVRTENGKSIKEGPVGGSIGARGLLRAAGVITE